MVQLSNGGLQEKHKDIKPAEFAGNTLGGKFGNVVIRSIKKITESLTDWFEERLINFAVGTLIKIEQSGKTIFAPLIKELKDKKAIPDFLKPIFDEIENPKSEIGAMLASTAGGSAIGGLFGAIFDPLMAPVKYSLMEMIHPIYPAISEGLMGWRRGTVSKEMAVEFLDAYGIQHKFRDMMLELSRSLMGFADVRDSYLRGDTTEVVAKEYIKKQGYEDVDVEKIFKLFIKIPDISSSIIANFRGDVKDADLSKIAYKNGIDKDFLDTLISANRQLLGLADIRSVYYRENKPESWLDEQLKKIGFTSDTATELKKVLPYFPGVPDLIRFAVREVYSPEIVSKYGQMEDLPPKFLEEAKKAGLPEEQAKNYWASHWELPSASMGYEMLHRGVIEYEELETLLRTLDVMPYWRDKIIKIAYSPYTRVDIRRLFKEDVLTEAEMLQAYKDIGYDDEHATKLKDWTIKTTYPEDESLEKKEKDLTLANITDGYKRSYFTAAETETMILELGYDNIEAEYFIAKVDYKNEIEKKKETVSLIEQSYKKGIMNDNDVISALAAEGFLTTEINYYLIKWTAVKAIKTATPSKAELKIWLTKKIITKDEYIGEMAGLGYTDSYIDLYLKEATGKGL